MKSLRRLIRHAGLIVLAGLLLFFSLLVYAGGDALLRRYVDGRLLGLAQTLAKIIEQHPNLIDSSNDEYALAAKVGGNDTHERELQEVAHSLMIFSPEGRVVWKGPEAVAQHPLPDDTVFQRLRLGHTVFETVESVEGTPIRHLFLPIPSDGQLRYVLHAEASLLFYRASLNGLVILLLVGSGIVLLLAWIASGWLANTILTPIERLSTGSEAMCAADLRKRLVLDSPYQEFRRLTQAFNSVMDRFQRGVESQRRFVDHAAHEMQTPLTVLQGNLEVALLKARTAEEYREALINNLEQVARLITLTRSLLTLAKFTSDSPPLHVIPLSLESLVKDLIAELKLLFDERQIRLCVDAHSVPLIQGDAQWIKQALINLLDNALRYTPPGGTVTVRLQTAGKWLSVTVEDTGHGIESEHLPHLFERFYRTDWARAKDSGGTGLGLPIVKEIVEAHGGGISVTSQVDKGSAFVLRFPVSSDLPS
jgi:heavy metal sensor kinase